MRFKLVLLAVVSAALLATGTAFAYITAPPQSQWRSLTGCFSPQQSVQVSQGQYLRLGWGTVSQQQALDFLAAQNFSLVATGINGTTGTYTLADWGTGNTGLWTAPALTDTPNTLGNKPIWVTLAFIQVNIPTGNYSISTAGTSVNRAVFDGQNVTKKSENWYAFTNCTLSVI